MLSDNALRRQKGQVRPLLREHRIWGAVRVADAIGKVALELFLDGHQLTPLELGQLAPPRLLHHQPRRQALALGHRPYLLARALGCGYPVQRSAS